MRKSEEKKQKSLLSMYRRILRIDRLLSEGTYPTLEDLEQDREIEASRATVYRTIEFMRNQLNAPVAKDAASKGWYYTDRTFRLPLVFTTEQEMFAVTTLKNMLRSLEGTPLFDSAKKILELIERSPVRNPTDAFSGADRDFSEQADSEWISKRYVFLGDFGTEVARAVWDRLALAMRQNREVEFDYVRRYDGTEQRRRARPCQVIRSKEGWTLWAWDLSRNEFRLFTMTRISAVRVTDERFELPKDFEYEKHSGEREGVWYNPGEAEFKILLDAEAEEEARNYPWGRNMKARRSDGGTEISFSSSNYERLMRKVLSLGGGARPLEPEDFAADYAARVQRMARATLSAGCFR